MVQESKPPYKLLLTLFFLGPEKELEWQHIFFDKKTSQQKYRATKHQLV